MAYIGDKSRRAVLNDDEVTLLICNEKMFIIIDQKLTRGIQKNLLANLTTLDLIRI